MAKCNKKKLSKKEAASFINYLQNNKGDILEKRKETRYYHCPLCNAWHTTQLDRGDNRTIKDIDTNFTDKWNKLINS